jgi:hypothetical protein
MTVENHGLRFEGIPHRILQENRPRSPNFRQIQPQQFQQMRLPVNRFRIFHGRLRYSFTSPSFHIDEPTGGLQHPHPLSQEAIYATLPLTPRQRLRSIPFPSPDSRQTRLPNVPFPDSKSMTWEFFTGDRLLKGTGDSLAYDGKVVEIDGYPYRRTYIRWKLLRQP